MLETSAPSRRILVVEDEPDIAKLMEYNLASQGHQVSLAESGELGLKSARCDPPDLILLDLMLPGLDGLEVCKQLRQDQKTESIPIIMVTARGEETDIVSGLEMGADDYIVKPFSTAVLSARVKSVLRRHSSNEDGQGVIEYGVIAIHPGRHEVQISGQKVDLTASEFQILHYLLRHRGWVFTRGQIVDVIRGKNYAVTERSIDVQMVGIRKKLGDAASYIETVRGVGYRVRDDIV